MTQSFASGIGFKINVTYDPSVSSTAQAAFNTVISTYENIFTTNVTVNLYVQFGPTGLGESLTQQQDFSYSAWRAAMVANATANPGNTYNAAAAASLPSADPIGNGNVVLNQDEMRPLSGVPSALGTWPTVFEGKDSRPPGQCERKGTAG